MSLLPDADSFHRLADGSAKGPVAALSRAALTALSVPYGLAMTVRNAAYDRHLLRIVSAPVPVVSVGNLTLGGTGKTPLVAWIAKRLCEAGLHVTIVSRGYGAKLGERSDESAELGILLPNVPHRADRDRVAAARVAAEHGADVVLLDDGFQHRRLARDLDIVAVDATNPFGCGFIFPRGLLREPLVGLCRAQAVVLTRASFVTSDRRAEIRRTLAAVCGSRLPAVWAEASHAPVHLRTASGTTMPLDFLRGKRIAGFAGIGNPAAFRTTLEKLGSTLVGFRALADHHAYSREDNAAIAGWAHDLHADAIVTTLKDLVKVEAEHLGDIPLVALQIAIEITAGLESFDRVLRTIVSRSPSGSTRTQQTSSMTQHGPA